MSSGQGGGECTPLRSSCPHPASGQLACPREAACSGPLPRALRTGGGDTLGHIRTELGERCACSVLSCVAGALSTLAPGVQGHWGGLQGQGHRSEFPRERRAPWAGERFVAMAEVAQRVSSRFGCIWRVSCILWLWVVWAPRAGTRSGSLRGPQPGSVQQAWKALNGPARRCSALSPVPLATVAVWGGIRFVSWAGASQQLAGPASWVPCPSSVGPGCLSGCPVWGPPDCPGGVLQVLRQGHTTHVRACARTCLHHAHAHTCSTHTSAGHFLVNGQQECSSRRTWGLLSVAA